MLFWSWNVELEDLVATSVATSCPAQTLVARSFESEKALFYSGLRMRMPEEPTALAYRRHGDRVTHQLRRCCN